MVIEHLQVRDMEKQRKLFEQQIERREKKKKRCLNGDYNWKESGIITNKLKKSWMDYWKKKELAHRNKEMESEKKEEEAIQRRKTEEMKFQMWEKLVQEAKDTDRTEDDKLNKNDRSYRN